MSRMNLTQAYLGQMGENGTHEVGREAVVAPDENVAGVNWIIQDAGNGYDFIINRESGLFLSRNSAANHLVQVYQRLLSQDPDGHLWKFDWTESGNYVITHKASGMTLFAQATQFNDRRAFINPANTNDQGSWNPRGRLTCSN